MLKMLPDVVMISGCVAERMHIKYKTFQKNEGSGERNSSVLSKDIIICISFMLVKSTFMRP